MKAKLCTCGHAIEWHTELKARGPKLCSTKACDCSTPTPSGQHVDVPAVMQHTPPR